MKKNIIALALGVSVFLLAGCGAKDVTTNPPMQKQVKKTDAKQATNMPEVKTPTPSGKVDATVDAIIGGADSEKTQVTSDENDVKTMLDDSADSNNLSKTYEQEL